MRLFLHDGLFQDVDDLEWGSDAGMIGVGEHLVALFIFGAPETMVGLDTGIRRSLGIADLIAEGDGVVSRDIELLEGMLEENGITSELPHLTTSSVLSTDAVDLHLGKDGL